jgi:hypothetical protein
MPDKLIISNEDVDLLVYSFETIGPEKTFDFIKMRASILQVDLKINAADEACLDISEFLLYSARLLDKEPTSDLILKRRSILFNLAFMFKQAAYDLHVQSNIRNFRFLEIVKNID